MKVKLYSVRLTVPDKPTILGKSLTFKRAVQQAARWHKAGHAATVYNDKGRAVKRFRI